MDIVEIADDDIAAVVALWRRCDLLRPWNDPHADIRRARRTRNACLLVGKLNARIVATLMSGFDGHRGWIYYVAVDPDQRMSGCGRAIMAAAESWLRARGAPKVQLMVSDENAAALGFYDALGYERLPVVTLGKLLP
jgi:ribosomal protein S18 acetylase RimI-like enzyme